MYKPVYTWPNPAFPFRAYYESEKVRIFIIENIIHNYIWLKKWSSRFRETDFFFVYLGWYHDENLCAESNQIFELLGLSKTNFFVLYNSEDERKNFSKLGFTGDLINHNAWLDFNFVAPTPLPKKYDAVYLARHSPFKRHYLTSRLSNLALIMGQNHGNISNEPLPSYSYKNEVTLTPKEVFDIISQSRVGLALSEIEGACFSSSEYLLCDVPVVSTSSKGGRDVWYTQRNSVIVDNPTQESVRTAVDQVLDLRVEEGLIRDEHIALQRFFRKRFIEVLGEVLRKFGDDHDPTELFEKRYIHKLRRSNEPNFEEIWA